MTRGSQLLEGASLEACSLEALLLAPAPSPDRLAIGAHALSVEGRHQELAHASGARP